MERRDFLKYTFAGVGTTLVAPAALTSCNPARGTVPVPSWTWYVAGKDHNRLSRDLHLLKKYGFEGIHLQGDRKTVEKAAREAHRLGLRLHQWIITLMSRDPQIAEDHPDWFVVSREGKSSLEYPPYVKYYKWLCPNHQGVVDHLEKKVKEIAAIPGLEGIHLDYIRFPDVILPVGLWKKYDIVQDREYPQYDFCYCDVCRSRFKAEQGVDPLDLPDPSADKDWLQFRYDSITRLVNHLYEVAREEGKKLSAAVFPTPAIARKLVRQEWDRWNLDAVFPMMYHNFYEEDIAWLEEAVKEGENALKGRFPLYAGLFIPAINPPEMPGAVRYVAKGGAQGLCLFRYGSMDDKHWKHFLVRQNT
jgi:uncharacterized lipoprotein YddW (UPF0748 family)